jgi:hypothetical protein
MTKPINSYTLYSGFVSALKFLQLMGYFIAVISGFGVASNFGTSSDGNGILVVGSFLAIVFCFSIYISTEGFIAVIDLLGRIEQNTRQDNSR